MNITVTLVAQSLSFFMLVVFTMKYVWPPIMNALSERTKKIADGLAEAEKGHHELELAEKRSAEILREGKEKSKEFIDLGQKRHDEIVDEAKDNARIEGERIITAARGAIDQERQQAKDALRAEVSALAIAGAEQILMREVDKNAHNEVLDKISAGL
ncbi:MAG: F0F1 ATP synthase subunit B [Gammaproteobacteria bacterium]|nr:MAG: F0F1 ATP synthase subunit B [Gammaproteobacteria bacterium]